MGTKLERTCRCDLHGEPVHWEASVNSRTSKRPAGCPVCGGLRCADQRRQPSERSLMLSVSMVSPHDAEHGS